jgi:hypothetical protein
MPTKSPYAKYDLTEDGLEKYCVTDDWDFGDFNETWFYHVLNIPRFRTFHEADDVFKPEKKEELKKIG